MGRDKALLPFGPGEVLLARVVRIIGDFVPPERIVCVAALEQELPVFTTGVRVVRDEEPDRGPLAALATGLAALGSDVEAVFVCGCDAPLLKPAFGERLFELVVGHQVAAPRHGEQLYPLPAVYRSDVLPQARSLLAGGERSLKSLLAACDARWVTTEELRDADPELDSLSNCNTEEDYRRTLAGAFPRVSETS
jgi:molybdopterin-guanine dinucleotide biosynthesis protein A